MGLSPIGAPGGWPPRTPYRGELTCSPPPALGPMRRMQGPDVVRRAIRSHKPPIGWCDLVVFFSSLYGVEIPCCSVSPLATADSLRPRAPAFLSPLWGRSGSFNPERSSRRSTKISPGCKARRTRAACLIDLAVLSPRPPHLPVRMWGGVPSFTSDAPERSGGNEGGPGAQGPPASFTLEGGPGAHGPPACSTLSPSPSTADAERWGAARGSRGHMTRAK
jgi:hypothetical protein